MLLSCLVSVNLLHKLLDGYEMGCGARPGYFWLISSIGYWKLRVGGFLC